ncbi:heavy-metal-associated domain-containing protein [Streptomonospora nanhaiensis]|uniref:Copper chaperone CopZ n=1 Tax=Streptomonospora nanhaiensis TaxID=1323731 RepID=A0A853BSC0_9ACTN|nr:heavy metal-associated domain-containing protein [Streptomonospora nanhaiensis]MBV2362160.1 heavy-metal-associated domain-containing protein [Streptomonospora nanhaiensis]NYI97401.1 copper chaperone CopZ [Streptomonospora nanhaiensis]
MSDTASTPGAAVSTDYTVTGMHCGGCAASVRREVGALPGVTAVEVDVATGRVTVTGEGPADPAAVRAAVAQAGYTVEG